MTEANKEQIAFMRDCLNGMNEGNYEILKKITLDPSIEDDFIDKNLTISDYINEIDFPKNSFKVKFIE